MELTVGDLLVMGVLVVYCSFMAIISVWQILLLYRIWNQLREDPSHEAN